MTRGAIKYVASWVSEKLRKFCRNGQHECYLAVPGACRGRTDTVCGVHSDRIRDGNGQGCKGHDYFMVPGCFECHRWYENKVEPDDEKRWAVFDDAHRRWWCHLLETGKVKLL